MKLLFYCQSLLLSFFIVSCSNTEHLNDISKPLINGIWEVQEANFIGADEDIDQYRGINFFTFFGPISWANSKGKIFNFEENGLLFTNIITTDTKKELKFSYKYDKDIFILPNKDSDNQSLEFNVEVIKLESESMEWKLGELMIVKLVKR
jgi:hypothetical protein